MSTYGLPSSGHAPGYLRGMFQDWLAMWPEGWPDASIYDVELEGDDGGPRSARWLLGRLRNCGDILPSSDCDLLEIAKGSTYAQAIQYIKQKVPDTGTATPALSPARE